MVFSTTNLFKGVQCPENQSCGLINCIFTHDSPSPPTLSQPHQHVEQKPAQPENPPPSKRRKTHHDGEPSHPPPQHPVSTADRIRKELAEARNRPCVGPAPPSSALPLTAPPYSTTSISPRPANGHRREATAAQGAGDGTSEAKHGLKKADKPAEPLRLNPRLIPHDPAGHNKRTSYLKYLHGEMVRLNGLPDEPADPSAEATPAERVCLDEQTLIGLALDEEEKVAREQRAVYGNVIKQRIAAYKKMKRLDWTQHVRQQTTAAAVKPSGTAESTQPPPIVTGLTPDEEVQFLPHLVADQTNLTNFGYIADPPTEAQAREAAAAVEASKHYEVCERCAARFQVFPTRDEAGRLTSRGPCRYHPDRCVFAPKPRNDFHAASKEASHPCCDGAVGSEGCTTHADHVFKTDAPARLAAVLPFIVTPANPAPAPDPHGRPVRAVCFDCEMGYTALGLELIRVTAVSWPSGDALLDVLVRPLGTVIDLNSRFSGVWPEHYVQASPHASGGASMALDPGAKSPSLPVVDSPAAARDLLLAHLTPTTPLLGHAIDNDLRAIRLCHPTIVDTVLLFSHPRGLPFRRGLRVLAREQLGRRIQTGGARGHDSLEDARATGDLVRATIRDRWPVLRGRHGWRFENGVLVIPTKARPIIAGVGRLESGIAVDGTTGAAGSKRKREAGDEAEEGVRMDVDAAKEWNTEGLAEGY